MVLAGVETIDCMVFAWLIATTGEPCGSVQKVNQHLSIFSEKESPTQEAIGS